MNAATPSTRSWLLLSALGALLLGNPARAGAGGVEQELGGSAGPTIALDRWNPDRLANASVYEIRVSTDAGLTWTAPVSFPMPATHTWLGWPGGSALAYDGQGRLFWSQKALTLDSEGHETGIDILLVQCDPLTGEVLPGYPVNVTEAAGVPGGGQAHHNIGQDMISDDGHSPPGRQGPASPYQDRLYVGWTRDLVDGRTRVHTSYSTDQGQTWSFRSRLDGPDLTEGFKFPVDLAVAPNGDLYVSYHSASFDGGVPGRVFILRSTDGGETFPEKTLAFGAGEADVTVNTWWDDALWPLVDGARFVMLGNWYPWILPDPLVEGKVHVVTATDRDGLGVGDPADVSIATSTDSGQTWGAPTRIDTGTGDTFQVLPAAAIDPMSGTIVVSYYDNRGGNTNPAGDYLLDLHATRSTDGGVTFQPDEKINTLQVDPTFEPPLHPGAPCFLTGCGEYFEAAWGSSPSSVYATGGYDILHWDGAQWSVDSAVPIPGSWFASLWGSGPDDVFAVGSNGAILHYDGVAWTQQASGTSELLLRVWGASPTDVFAVGLAGTILHYDGVAWTPQASGVTVALSGVWGADGSNVWAVGWEGTILHYDGVSWTPQASGTDVGLQQVWGTSGSVLAVGYEGIVLHSADGSSWSSSSGPAGRHPDIVRFRDIRGSGPSDVHAIGYDVATRGRILRWDGSSWTDMGPEAPALVGLWQSGSDLVAVGESGAIHHYDGAQWTTPPNPGQSSLQRLWVGDSNGALALWNDDAYVVWGGNRSSFGQQSVFLLEGSTDVPAILQPPVSAIALGPPMPNPFRSETLFTYAVPRDGRVRLSLHDVAGRRVVTLVDADRTAGRHTAVWGGADAVGSPVAAGVYFLRLESAGQQTMKRIVRTR